MKLDQNKTALSLGIFIALMHVGWVVLVAIGLAQKLMDFIYNLHFLNNPFNVMSFDLATSAILIIITFVVGYVMGWFFALIWNISMGKK